MSGSVHAGVFSLLAVQVNDDPIDPTDTVNVQIETDSAIDILAIDEVF